MLLALFALAIALQAVEGGNELWATGEFRETGQGKNSEPLPIKGYWACIYVREGDDWKIRVAAWYTHRNSVIVEGI